MFIFRNLTKQLAAFFITSFYAFLPALSQSPLTVGIIQVIEHPALDRTREGILDELEQQNLAAGCRWESAQGNPALATQIAAKFLGQNVQVMVGIATMPAQVALKQSQSSGIPVVFSSVTDAASAKLTGSVTGVLNFIEVEKQIQFIQKIIPSVKRIGTIYNPGEAFSETLIQLATDVCKKKGITFTAIPASKTSDVPVAAQNLTGKVDVIFINNDNTSLAAFESIVKVASQLKVPVFSSDVDSVEKGAIAALGPDQYEVGRQTGKMIASILKKEKTVQEIPVVGPEKVDIRLNFSMAKELGIDFPNEFVKESSSTTASERKGMQ